MYGLPRAMAGVAIVNSPSGLRPTTSNAPPARITYVSPSSLSAKALSSQAQGDVTVVACLL